MDRRKFTALTGAAILGSLWGTVSDTVANLSWFSEVCKSSIPEENMYAARSLFGLNPNMTSILPANANPRVRDRLLTSTTPQPINGYQDMLLYFSRATVDASLCFRPFFTHSIEKHVTGHQFQYKKVKELVLANKKHGIVALGSPTSNFLIRSMMFYKECDDSLQGHEHDKESEDALHLPIKFELRRNAIISSENQQDRWYRLRNPDGNPGDDKAPNWGLVENNELILPATDGDGHLLEDYLIISVLPNFLTPESLADDVPVVVMGGTHSVGTRAIGKFFEDKSLLPDLKRKLDDQGNPKFWQAAVKVVLKPETEKIDYLTIYKNDIFKVGVNKEELMKHTEALL